jgi:hypothetical protein
VDDFNFDVEEKESFEGVGNLPREFCAVKWTQSASMRVGLITSMCVHMRMYICVYTVYIYTHTYTHELLYPYAQNTYNFICKI